MFQFQGQQFLAPGFAINVCQNNTIIFEKYAGLANLKNPYRITSQTNFRLASLTKQFTTMAILLLYEKKLLNLDDSLSTFFPGFPEYGENVTLRQLLSHTSGMPDYEKPLYKILKYGEEPTMYDAFTLLKKQKLLLFPPGSKNKYSESGYVLLALIVERVSKQKYADFLKENIFRPLGMKNTIVLDETKPRIPNQALGYKKIKNDWVEYDYDPLNFVVGNEGIYSSINDLQKWITAWMEDKLVSKPTLQEAFSPDRLSNGRNGKFGFSWTIDNWNSKQVFYQLGSWVGFNNILVLIPDKKLSLIFLSNTNCFSQNQRIGLAKKMLKNLNL